MQMLSDNITALRKMNGYSQEQVAERIGITRQAYAKWERGTTVPDIEKASMLAHMYGITVDSLINADGEVTDMMPPAPPGKNIWGTVTIGERGQIVIPKAARDKFGFKAGDRLIVLSDEVGIALLPTEFLEAKFLEHMGAPPSGTQ